MLSLSLLEEHAIQAYGIFPDLGWSQCRGNKNLLYSQGNSKFKKNREREQGKGDVVLGVSSDR